MAFLSLRVLLRLISPSAILPSPITNALPLLPPLNLVAQTDVGFVPLVLIGFLFSQQHPTCPKITGFTADVFDAIDESIVIPVVKHKSDDLI